MEWTVNEPELRHYMNMLDALQNPTRGDHVAALQALEQLSSNPSFILNTLHIFVKGAAYTSWGLSTASRQLGGLIIKNYVFKSLLQLPPDVQFVLRRDIVSALNDPIADIRRTGATLIGKVAQSCPISSWGPELLPSIFSMLDVQMIATYPDAVDGALKAIRGICEESAYKLASEDSTRPLDTLIPKLLELMSCDNSSHRLNALESYNALLYLLDITEMQQHQQQIGAAPSSPAGANNVDLAGAYGRAAHPLRTNMNLFIAKVAAMATDSNAEVRCAVCRGLTSIACLDVSTLGPFFANTCEFMLGALRDSEESVAIEATEFFVVLMDQTETKKAMLPYLPVFIETLIDRLVISADELDEKRTAVEEENSGDKKVNLKPISHRASGGGRDRGEGAKEESELSSAWTLRNQAAQTLDMVGVAFPPEMVMTVAFPKLQQKFSPDAAAVGAINLAEYSSLSGNIDPVVLVRESGMLALGALCNGCIDSMDQYLPSLYAFLFQNARDPLPEMRAICCWVLSRISVLFASRPPESEPSGSAYYHQTLALLLELMFDANPTVQEAAVSALGHLIENMFYTDEGVSVLEPHILTVLTCTNRAFDVYGIKSSLLLLDTIGTLADCVESHLAIANFTPLYMPRVVARLDALAVDDPQLMPVLECLTSVLVAMGPLEAQPYVGHVYSRVYTIIHGAVQKLTSAAHFAATAGSGGDTTSTNGTPPEYDAFALEAAEDFLCCGFEVMSALCECLESNFASSLVVGDTGAGLLLMMQMAMQYKYSPEVRQNAYAFTGELCKSAFSMLSSEVIANIVTCAASDLTPEHQKMCGNAAWSIIELTQHLVGSAEGSAFLQPFLDGILASLVDLLRTRGLLHGLQVNIVTCIGSLAQVKPVEVGEYAPDFFGDWCSQLNDEIFLRERLICFKGLLAMITQTPSLVLGSKTHIHLLLKSCGAWAASLGLGEEDQDVEDISAHAVEYEQVMRGLQSVLKVLQTHDRALWDKIVVRVDPLPAQVVMRLLTI